MSANRDIRKRGVKVEAVDTACGKVPHMSVDQLAQRFNIESRELHCPACGRIHLSDEDAKNAEDLRYSDSERFQQIKEEAEGQK